MGSSRRWLRCPGVFWCPRRGTASEIQAESQEEEELICRYCFEDGSEGDELISPCNCSGGQKYVHLKCLRMWQRAVLVAQPTHPDFYDQDTRQRICNVCKAPFTCPPPTRAELLASFTGPELAALIEEQCFIASSESFSRELDREVSRFPSPLRDGIVCNNWIRGAFLIVKVVQERNRGPVLLKIDDEEELNLFVRQLDADARTFHLRGRRFSILPTGPLRNLVETDSPEERRRVIREARTPAAIRLRPDPSEDCGEDGILAVNLARPFELFAAGSARTGLRARQRTAFHSAKMRVLTDFQLSEDGQLLRDQLLTEVTHFVGGPCEEEKVACCIILTREGYTVIQEDDCLMMALERAEARASLLQPAQGATAEGIAAVEALGLTSEATSKRRKVTPEAASNAEIPPVRLFVFWGYAGWSRCQLMGEIARGSWGLCKALPDDVMAKHPSEVYSSIYPRLVFAPPSEMSERYGSEVPEEDTRRQQLRRMAIIHDLLTREGRREDAVREALAEFRGIQEMQQDTSDDDEEPIAIPERDVAMSPINDDDESTGDSSASSSESDDPDPTH